MIMGYNILETFLPQTYMIFFEKTNRGWKFKNWPPLELTGKCFRKMISTRVEESGESGKLKFVHIKQSFVAYFKRRNN